MTAAQRKLARDPTTSPQPPTPPSSPGLLVHKQTVNPEVVQLLVDLLKAAQAIQTGPCVAAEQGAAPETVCNREEPHALASTRRKYYPEGLPNQVRNLQVALVT